MNWLDESEIFCTSSGGTAWGNNASLMNELKQSSLTEQAAEPPDHVDEHEYVQLPNWTFGL